MKTKRHNSKCNCHSANKTLVKLYDGKTIALKFTFDKKKGISKEHEGTDNGALLLLLAAGYLNNSIQEDVPVLDNLYHQFLYDCIEMELAGEIVTK